MCFSAPQVEQKTVATPKRDDKASLAQEARRRTLLATGVSGAVATSPLGDSGFGANVRRTTLGGGTAAGMR